jgi:hypothetical protein
MHLDMNPDEEKPKKFENGTRLIPDVGNLPSKDRNPISE